MHVIHWHWDNRDFRVTLLLVVEVVIGSRKCAIRSINDAPRWVLFFQFTCKRNCNRAGCVVCLVTEKGYMVCNRFIRRVIISNSHQLPSETVISFISVVNGREDSLLGETENDLLWSVGGKQKQKNKKQNQCRRRLFLSSMGRFVSRQAYCGIDDREEYGGWLS